MKNDAYAPYTGPDTIDVTKIRDKLVDHKTGDMTGVQREKPGYIEVADELSKAMPKYGSVLGIHPDVYKQFLEVNDTLAAIRAAKPEAAKLAEVLSESEMFYEDLREAIISRICGFVDTTVVHGDPSVAAAYEKTMKYRGQYAEKAAATRRKNEMAQAEEVIAEVAMADATPVATVKAKAKTRTAKAKTAKAKTAKAETVQAKPAKAKAKSKTKAK
jgi:hypothetical protein